MEITTFKDMYIAELQELASVVRQVEDCLPAVEKAVHPALRRIILDTRQDTQLQKERLAAILQMHGAELEAHTDQAMQAIVSETSKMLPMLKGDDDLRDAGLIASIQRLKHYEIAVYGTAAALAGQLKLRDDQDVLLESLEEEKLTDVELTALAEQEVNPDALAA